MPDAVSIALTILAFIFVISLLVFIHEAGHFLLARWRRVWVHQFALGMGPALWKRRIGQTEYSIRAFPIGGYVRMAGEDRLSEEDQAVPPELLFPRKHPWERMAIVAAGPLANIFSAVLIQMAVSAAFGGVPYQEVAGFSKVSPARESLQIGDRIAAIDGQFIYSQAQAIRLIRGSGGKSLQIQVLRGDRTYEFDMTPAWDETNGNYVIGTYFVYSGKSIIRTLDGNSALARAGLKPGDRIAAVDGVAVFTWNQFAQQVAQALSGTQAVQLTVQRAGQTLTTTLDLKDEANLEMALNGSQPVLEMRPVSLAQLFTVGFGQIPDFFFMVQETLRQIFTGQRRPDQALSGPVGIANILGQSLKIGPIAFFAVVVALSLSLGFLNLFPFPALDGSRIVFTLIEMILRRPIPPEKEGMLHYLGFIVLIGLILFITISDIRRLFSP
jgi:regulator of sigma E protease